MSIAGLKLTFPSRTRSIRSLATMVLHIRVWESSSMPGFFLPFFQGFSEFFTDFNCVLRRDLRRAYCAFLKWGRSLQFFLSWNFEIAPAAFQCSRFYYIFFPVFTAGLKLTFPSRTRSIRCLATMVLHSRVWESSSMPGFFLHFSGERGKMKTDVRHAARKSLKNEYFQEILLEFSIMWCILRLYKTELNFLSGGRCLVLSYFFCSVCGTKD